MKCGLLVYFGMSILPGLAYAQNRLTPHWVWHNEGDPAQGAPAGERFFRKTVVFDRLRVVKVDVTADDEFVLYLNGHEVGRGADWHRVVSFDVTEHAQVGTNVLAVRATNNGGPAGLLVRGYVGWANGTQWTFSSDGSWRSTAEELPGWERPTFDDSSWTPVNVLGEVGKAGLWRGMVWDSGYSERFIVPDGFRVDAVAPSELTGSLIAMTFDSLGRPTISREHGPAGILEDTDGDGVYDGVLDFGSDVKESQGLYWIGRSLYTAARGPSGDGLYRITDDDADDRSDRVELLTKYRGGIGGHGPHAITLGPDGMVYHIVGNHAFITKQESDRSPVRQHWLYEGVVLPRYEDPRGHAAGLRVPGGTIWRLDRDGTRWDLISAGYRNPYDAAFNAAGELLTYDADMEWDVGLPWYRPTRVVHSVPGSEFGWRSGNAKWPEYYLDSLPAVRDVGRGSPTGVMVYQHTHYPPEYRDTLWLGDWTNGVILVEHLRPFGATYQSTPEVFARGEPMNITDLEVGPDGNVYFCTGGWGTAGGVYRITWTRNAGGESVVSPSGGEAATAPTELVERAIRQPQPLSAWAVEQVERLRRRARDAWGPAVVAVAADTARSAADRVRAVDVLQIHGPQLDEKLALSLARDAQSIVRACVIPLLGEMATPAAVTTLAELLNDSDPFVRRRACEALVCSGGNVDPQRVLPLLSHEDRFIRWAARSLLQRIDPARWELAVLASNDPRLVTEGLVALNTVAPGRDVESRLAKTIELLETGEPQDESFVGALRVAQVILLAASNHPPAEVDKLRQVLVDRFPTRLVPADRETARLLAQIQAGNAAPKIVRELLRPDASREDQVHYAFCLRYLDAGWTPELRRQYVEWFEGKHRWEGGFSFSMYIQGLLADVATKLPLEERRAIVREWGTTMPTVVAAIVRSFPQTELADLIPALIEMDGTLSSGAAVPASQVDDRAARDNLADAARLADEVTLALGRSADSRAREHLRAMFAETTERRDIIVRALAVAPAEDDWALLVEGLKSTDAAVLRASIEALARLQTKPTGAAPYRSLIAATQRLGDAGGVLAVRLHNQWAGIELPTKREEMPKAIETQKNWFAEQFPGERLAEAEPAKNHHWKFEEILAHLTQNNRGRNGNVARGRRLFEQSVCIKCHRFEGSGNGIGPDLTTLGKRFKREDILTATYFPSRDINDQYRSVIAALANGTLVTGMQAPPDGDHLVFLQSDGSVQKIPKNEVTEVRAATVSIMPEGGLDVYDLNEIADLMAFLLSGEEKNAAGSVGGGSSR